ncbi:MAG: hypothetical protein KJ674_02995 [Nanoarchaeota archaeon]|nr:hypothetical protein [Nanoarchaeota archaeon]
MEVKLLGVVDLLAAFSLILLKFGLLKQFAIIIGLILLVKSLVFFNIVGFIDIIAVFVMALAFMGISGIITWVFVVWLIQKGLFSLLG